MNTTKISEAKHEEIVNKLQMDIEAANAYYEGTIEPVIVERYAIYKADPAFYKKMFPALSKRSSITSTDVQDTIESTMPSMMKTFFGSTDVITIQGEDGSDGDDKRANIMQELINYQLEKNKFFMTFYEWAKDALITNAGILKVDWDREYKPVQEFITLDAEAYEQYRPQAEQAGIKILGVQQVPGGYQVKITQKQMTKNEPRIMNIMASEFRFSPDATNLADADFVAHRKIVSLDYLRKQQAAGMYEHVDELTEKAKNPHYTTLDTKNNEHVGDESNNGDSGRRKVELYECYVNINMSDDPNSELTKMIITVSNGVILRMDENTYERVPFFVLSPRIDPHKIWPDTGFVDLIAQLQHAKTAILRQMIVNIAQGNDGKIAVDPSRLTDINDVIENARVIRVQGNVSEAIQPVPVSPLQSWTFNMMEYLDTTKENRTGITKYNQGMDSNSLNKTATGINIITQQANQRLELIARIFAETGMSDLFRFLIKMNQLFINESTVIRLTNEQLTIDPTDLDGDFDLVVNAGMGAGAKQTNIQNMQALQELMTQLYQLGFVGPEQVYNFAKRYIEEIGFKNVDDFVMSPQDAQQAQAAKAQPQDTMSESMRAAVTDAPWQVQMQWWAKQGFQVDEDMFTEQAAQRALATAVDAHAKADATRGGGMNGAGPRATAQAAGAGRPAGSGMSGLPRADAREHPEMPAGPVDGGYSSGALAGSSAGLPSAGNGMQGY